jgi:hypothetical protein
MKWVGLRRRSHRAPHASTSPYARSGRQVPTAWAEEGGHAQSQAQTPAGAAKAVRPAPRSQTHGESQIRVHLTICPKQPAASEHVDRRGGTRKRSGPVHRAANAVRLAAAPGLRRAGCGRTARAADEAAVAAAPGSPGARCARSSSYARRGRRLPSRYRTGEPDAKRGRQPGPRMP